MPYDMELFTKKNKKILFFSLGILMSVELLLFMLAKLENDNSSSKFGHYRENSGLLLHKANDKLSFAPDSSEQIAIKVLAGSTFQNDPLNQVRSLLLIAKIKNLKGKTSLALTLYSKAYSLATSNKIIKEQCESLLSIGEIIYKRGEYDNSLAWFSKADTIARENKIEPYESYAIYYLGKYNQTKGQFARAKMYYLKALALARKSNDAQQLALILPSLGKYYISEGKLNVALSCYLEAFRISTKLNDQLLSADVCNHLGGLYLQINDYGKAMEFHRKSLQYRRQMNFPGELAKSYNNMGKIFLDQNQWDSAVYYFEESFMLCESINYKKGKVKALINLGKVSSEKNDLVEAERNLSMAYGIASESGYDVAIAESSIELGNVYTLCGKQDSALKYYTASLHKLSRSNYNDLLLKTYQGLFSIYKLKNKLEEAITYQTLVLETEKKLLDVENKKQLAILSITFDTERKERDYQVLLKDNALKASQLESKNTFIGLIVALLGFSVIFCLYMYNRLYVKKKANKLLEQLNHKIILQNAELEKLNRDLEYLGKEKDKLFSIISHELRNPLYWLQNLAEVLSRKYHTMSPEKVRKTLLALDESSKNVYHLMDNLLHWSRSKLNRVHPRKTENNLFTLVSETTGMYESFFQQKEISFYNGLSKDIFIYADADLFSCVVRNLISNAIKYTPNGGQISITYQFDKAYATLIISDTGKGISDSNLKNIFISGDDFISMPGLMKEKGSGLGLKLCKDFVELNDGWIWVETLPGLGTKCFFTVPVSTTTTFATKNLQLAQILN